MRILKVEQVVRYLRELFDSNSMLQDLWVQGQISNVTKSAQGHWYFTLKERDSTIKCAAFRSSHRFWKFRPQDGLAVLASMPACETML